MTACVIQQWVIRGCVAVGGYIIKSECLDKRVGDKRICDKWVCDKEGASHLTNPHQQRRTRQFCHP